MKQVVRSGVWHRWLCWSLAMIGCGAMGASASPAFPGRDPGTARGSIDGGELILENDILKARWSINGGLRLVDLTDKITGNVWMIGSGECLEMTVYQSPWPQPRTLYGSAMQIVGEPQLLPGQQIAVHLHDADTGVDVEWRATLRNGSNDVRQSATLRAGDKWVQLNRIAMIDLPAPEAVVRGSVDGSPVVTGNWFVGLEHPMSRSEVADGRIRCSYPAPPLEPGATQQYTSVIGLAPPGQMRRAFLYYLERERAQPYRPYLHHNNGEDSGHIYAKLLKTDPQGMEKFRREQDQWWLNDIEQTCEQLVVRRGVKIDAFVHDYLWSDESKIWQFHEGFAEGFDELRRAAEKHGASLGIWLTPWARTGGIGRILAGPPLGFETMSGMDEWGSGQNRYGLSLAGPRYFARFRAACMNFAEHHGVTYYKFDGFGDGNNVTGAGPYVSDVEALLRVIRDLRAHNPTVFINATTGTWPSPFWLLDVDSTWRQGLDVGTLGKGSSRQQWITFRDSETYHNIVARGPLYPLNSIMLHGIGVNLASTGEVGMPRVVGLDPDDIIDEIRSFFGSGTNCQELYVTPAVMTERTWDALAEAAKWSRANAGVLVDTHWICGDPARSEIYGWASWSPRKGILTLRNPDDQPASIELDLAKLFELPAGAPQTYQLASPWRDESGQPPVTMTAGRPHVLELAPFAVVVLEATPAQD